MVGDGMSWPWVGDHPHDEQPPRRRHHRPPPTAVRVELAIAVAFIALYVLGVALAGWLGLVLGGVYLLAGISLARHALRLRRLRREHDEGQP